MGFGWGSFGSLFALRQVCLSRDTHGWGADRLNSMHASWEPTPEHMILMDVKVTEREHGKGYVLHSSRSAKKIRLMFMKNVCFFLVGIHRGVQRMRLIFMKNVFFFLVAG